MPAAIDVLLPVYNSADTLDGSLRSIAAQTFADFRVIAIDDGSTDHGGVLLRAWAARDPRFTVIRKANEGIVAALNAGLAAVTAPVIARLDGDDLCAPTRFAEQHAYLADHPDCVGVGCAVTHIDGRGRSLSGYAQPGPPELADPARIPAHEPYIIHPFLMARTSAMRAVGGYRAVPHSEDSDLFWRLQEIGTLHNLPAVLGKYRMHLSSISGSSIVNGRIMAFGSQLGALSARRRRGGHPDLEFAPDLMARLRKARDLAGMQAVVAPMLTAWEMPLFRLSVAVKLLELADYRPYEIEGSDCVFIRAAVDAAAALADPADRRTIDYFLTRTGSRLMRRGRAADVTRLVPRRLWRWTGLKTVTFR